MELAEKEIFFLLLQTFDIQVLHYFSVQSKRSVFLFLQIPMPNRIVLSDISQHKESLKNHVFFHLLLISDFAIQHFVMHLTEEYQNPHVHHTIL